ncbi:MAG: hypothetical protein IPM34_10215 [Saprospiraceae bacterium]|nr:hypothetical protein [Saprospiraceae bacterium]
MKLSVLFGKNIAAFAVNNETSFSPQFTFMKMYIFLTAEEDEKARRALRIFRLAFCPFYENCTFRLLKLSVLFAKNIAAFAVHNETSFFPQFTFKKMYIFLTAEEEEKARRALRIFRVAFCPFYENCTFRLLKLSVLFAKIIAAFAVKLETSFSIQLSFMKMYIFLTAEEDEKAQRALRVSDPLLIPIMKFTFLYK